MNIEYIRVSSDDQNTSRQEVTLQPYKIEKYYIEKNSGKNMDRPPELKKMLEYIREDTLYIESFSRLARSLLDLLNIVKLLQE